MRVSAYSQQATPSNTIHRALREVANLRHNHSSTTNPSYSATSRIVDLGSGDGRLCITAAKDFGYKAVGIEVSAA
jgi:cyclopropane fatty-acyl-phospholipid synthase-like methyltransferase